MAETRPLTRADLLPPETYAKERREHHKRVAQIKKNRRIEVGPYATFYFENFDTMWHQVHEMLHIEHGGEAQIAEELEAYNPLIPRGDDLIATVMFEIDDPLRRERALQRLGGVEDKAYIGFDGEEIRGIADPTRENTSPEGKASAVQFLRFPFTAEQKAKFRAPGTQIVVGFDHENYGHIAVMPEAVRSALAEDFS